MYLKPLSEKLLQFYNIKNSKRISNTVISPIFNKESIIGVQMHAIEYGGSYKLIFKVFFDGVAILDTHNIWALKNRIRTDFEKILKDNFRKTNEFDSVTLLKRNPLSEGVSTPSTITFNDYLLQKYGER